MNVRTKTSAKKKILYFLTEIELYTTNDTLVKCLIRMLPLVF